MENLDKISTCQQKIIDEWLEENSFNKHRHKFPESFYKELVRIYKRYLDLVEFYKIEINNRSFDEGRDRDVNLVYIKSVDALCTTNTFNSLKKLFSKKKYIQTKIEERANAGNLFFSQPIVPLVYLLINERGADAIKKRWPFPYLLQDLNLIISDIGDNASFPQYH